MRRLTAFRAPRKYEFAMKRFVLAGLVSVLVATGMATALGSFAWATSDTVPPTGPAPIGFATQPGNFQSQPIGTDFTVVDTLLNLPAGNYIVSARASVHSEIFGLHLVQCILQLESGNLVGEDASVTVEGSPHHAAVTLFAGFANRSTQDLSVVCRADEANVFFNQPSAITAIRVATLTTSP